MLGALAVYAIAAGYDVRTRRVPNVLWVVGGVLSLATTATALSVLSGLLVFAATGLVWLRGGIGGADVKAISLLPLALPWSWPVAILGTAVVSTGWMLGCERDEIPLCVPVFVGVVLGLFSRAYI